MAPNHNKMWHNFYNASKIVIENWAGYTFTAIFFAFVLLVLFYRAVGMSLSHDEFQFVAGGQFFRSNGLLPYVDYPFLHMPYMPIIYGLILNFGKDDLLTARLFNEIAIFLGAFLLFHLVTQIFRDAKKTIRFSMGAFAVLLFITNSSLAAMDGRALNHGIPILLSIASVWVYWGITGSEWRGARLFLCGLFIGIATGIRLNYAVLIVPFLFAILFDPHFNEPKVRLCSFFQFLSGFLFALLPAGILFLMAPKPFIYGNFHYIALNTIYRKNLGYTISMNLPGKFDYFYENVLSDPRNILLYTAGFGFVIAGFIRLLSTNHRNAFLISFVSLFGFTLLFSAFSPTPLWPQYFFGPVPFLILCLCLGLATCFVKRPVIQLLGLALLVASFAINPPVSEITDLLRQRYQQDRWTTTQMHQLGQRIHAQMNCAQNCKVLTLVPILPLEAGLDTYPVFTVGTFSWRTAPILSKERRAEYRIISYDDLEYYLESDPPAAILTGTEAGYDGFSKFDPGGLDQPFIDYALKHGYQPVKILKAVGDEESYLTLWVK